MKLRHYYPGGPRTYIEFGAMSETEAPYELKCAVRLGVTAALSYEGFGRDACVSVSFCDRESIQTLNRDHRGKDRVTDVLSFPQYEKGEWEKEGDTPCLLGDIVLCLPRAKEQAEEIGNTFYEEITFLCVHSTLHLLGYDHESSPQDEEDMLRRQREIIGRIKGNV